MKFNSQIATTIEQSKRLLELGLNPDTADLVYSNASLPYDKDVFQLVCRDYHALNESVNFEISPFTFIPAWSLHRLIDLCTEYINIDGYQDTTYWFTMHKLDNKIIYENDYNRWLYLGDGDNLFDTLIDCIDWLIKEGKFNTEYLK